MKRCPRCHDEQPLSEFYRESARSDGFSCWCKNCIRVKRRQHYAEMMADPVRREAEAERQRKKELKKYHSVLKYSPEYWQRRTRNTAVWRERNRDKARAHSSVSNALISGKIMKPEACEDCGGLVPLHAHHEDYALPLKVNWLCVKCHTRRHRDVVH